MDFIQEKVQADENGNWEITIPNNFSPGQHTAVIRDESSGDKGVVVFKNPEKPYLINKIQKISSDSSYVFAFIIFFVLVLLFIRKFPFDRYKNKTLSIKRLKKYLIKIKIFILAVIVILSALLVFNIIKENSFFRDNLLDYFSNEKKEVFDVRGSIVGPEGLGVAGVDLEVGNVSIHTEEGGFFSFDNMGSGSNIKITSPLLKKAILKKVDKGDMKIYFDYGLYNAVIDIVDLESRSRFSDIFDRYLVEDLKMNIDKDTFISGYKSVFDYRNVSSQGIVIGNVKILKEWSSEKYNLSYDMVFEVEVFGSSESKVFYLILNGSLWNIIV